MQRLRGLGAWGLRGRVVPSPLPSAASRHGEVSCMWGLPASEAPLAWKENPPPELFILTPLSDSGCVWVVSSLITLFGKLKKMLLACGNNGRTAAARDFPLHTSRKFIFLIKTPNCHVLRRANGLEFLMIMAGPARAIA